MADDQHLFYSVSVCNLLRIENVLVRRVRFLFDQNVASWNAALYGVITRGGGLGRLAWISLAAGEYQFPHLTFPVKVDGVIDSLFEDRGDLVGPDGGTEHDRGVGLSVRGSVAEGV